MPQGIGTEHRILAQPLTYPLPLVDGQIDVGLIAKTDPHRRIANATMGFTESPLVS